jgi:hypothetical protein
LGVFGLAEMAVFIALVFVAYAYVWKKGGLDWDQPARRVGATADTKVLAEISLRREVERRAG